MSKKLQRKKHIAFIMFDYITLKKIHSCLTSTIKDL